MKDFAEWVCHFAGSANSTIQYTPEKGAKWCKKGDLEPPEGGGEGGGSLPPPKVAPVRD